MKPKDWSSMTPEKKGEIASDLLNSMRGRLLLAQAIQVAVPIMRSLEKHEVEESNCQDMEMILEVFGFPIPLQPALQEKIAEAIA